MTATSAAPLESPLRSVAVAFWPIGVATLLYRVVQASGGDVGYDFLPLAVAVHRLFDGGEIYTTTGVSDFPYPPAALVLLAPFELVDVDRAIQIAFALNVAAILGAALLSLRVFGFAWRSPAGALTLFGLGLAMPVSYTIHTTNVNAFVLLGLTVALLAASRSRWAAAGVAIGVTLALKPILLPVVILFALYRQWRALALAAAIPVFFSAAVMAIVPRARDFLSETIPFLVRGQTDRIQSYSMSLSSVGERLGVSALLTGVVRVAVVVAAALVVQRLWRRKAEPVRAVEIATVLMIAAFLVSSFSFTHYGVYLLPAAVGVAHACSSLRSWPAWLAVYLVAAPDVWQSERLPEVLNDLGGARPTAGYLLLLGIFYTRARGPGVRDRAAASSPRRAVS